MALHPLHTMAHQQVDHIGGQAQIVVQAKQDTDVRCGQLLAQLLLHLGGQIAELHAALQPFRNVSALVGGFFVGGLQRHVLRRGHQAQLPQGLLRRLNTGAVPPQLPGQGPGLHIAVVPQEGQIQQGRVAVTPVQQPRRRLGGQRDALVRRMYQNIRHQEPSSPLFSYSPFYTKISRRTSPPFSVEKCEFFSFRTFFLAHILQVWYTVRCKNGRALACR